MKVTKKLGRRSRRRFKNNKNKKSSYKKRYAKTHKGGCWSAKKGGARSRKYGHKRGKRFHRGVGGDGDVEVTHIEPIDSSTYTTLQGYTKMVTAFEFECKRTDGKYFFSLPTTRIFDVLYPAGYVGRTGIKFLLCRHDKENVSYDKVLECSTQHIQKVNENNPISVTDIQGFKPDDITTEEGKSGTYTFQATEKNNKNFKTILDELQQIIDSYHL